MESQQLSKLIIIYNWLTYAFLTVMKKVKGFHSLIKKVTCQEIDK